MSNGDTGPDIQLRFREMLMRRSSIDRVEMMSEMFDAARAIALASCPSGMSEMDTKRFLCSRFYSNEVDVEAFMRALELSRKRNSEP
jgi:hypothetical protein